LEISDVLLALQLLAATDFYAKPLAGI